MFMKLQITARAIMTVYLRCVPCCDRQIMCGLAMASILAEVSKQGRHSIVNVGLTSYEMKIYQMGLQPKTETSVRSKAYIPGKGAADLKA